jgi:hypothetical protein
MGSAISLSSYESASSGLDQEHNASPLLPHNDCSTDNFLNSNSDTSPETTNSGADSSYHTYPYGMRKYASALDLNAEGLELALAKLMHGVSLSIGHHSCCYNNSSDPNLADIHSRRSSIHKILIRVKDISTQTDQISFCDIGVNTILNEPILELSKLSPNERQILQQKAIQQIINERKLNDDLLNRTYSTPKANDKQFSPTQPLNRSCSHNDVTLLDNHLVILLTFISNLLYYS